MKRLLIVGAACVLLCSFLLAGVIFATEQDAYVQYPLEGGVLYFDPTTGTVVSVDHSVTKAVIPQTIDGVEVTSIGAQAFTVCSELRSVELPDSVTSLGNHAFSGCGKLESIRLSDNIISIGDGAFIYCYQLKTIQLPKALQSFGSYAFSSTGIEGSITIPAGVTRLPFYGFSQSQSLTEVIFADRTDPERVFTTVEDNAFSGCINLERVSLPDSTISIGEGAFFQCKKLKSLNIPQSLQKIGYSAFGFCSAWEGTVTIPSGVTELSYGTFTNCESIEKVVFEGSMEVIPADTFRSCHNLKSVTFPQNLKTIKDYAFYQCISLKEILLPDTVTTIGYRSFYRNSAAEKLYLGQSLVTIGNEAFSGLKNVKELILPRTLESIGESAFYCLGVEELRLHPLFLGKSAFTGCSALHTLVIEEGMDYVPDHGFSGSSSLVNLTLPHTLTRIGSHAFSGAAVEQIVIPKNVKTIDTYAFLGTKNLWSVCFLGQRPTIGYRAFSLKGSGAEEYIDNPRLTFYFLESLFPTASNTWDGVHLPEYPYVYPFADVYSKDWYASAVSYVLENKLMNGVSETAFSPNGTMNRAMLVTVLWRYDGAMAEGEIPFTDVPNGQWFTDAVRWSYEHKIVNGVGKDCFAPFAPVTREQIVTILYRYATTKGFDTSSRGDLSAFSDEKQVSSYALEAMQWAVGEGLINGSNGKLLPKDDATRAQVAAIVMRFLENVAK